MYIPPMAVFPLIFLIFLLGALIYLRIRSRARSGRNRISDALFLIGGSFFAIALPSLFLPVLYRHHEPMRSDNCYSNLRELSQALEAFSNDEPTGLFPKLQRKPGSLMFANEAPNYANSIFPHYLTDLRVMICPVLTHWPPANEWRNPAIMVNDFSFFYLGYVVSNEAEMASFAAAYRQHIAEGLDFDSDLLVPEGTGNKGSNTLHRLGKSAERFIAADPNDPVMLQAEKSRIPVLMERVGIHFPQGAHIVFLDGHAEFMRFPGEWPMTTTTIDLLNSLGSALNPAENNSRN